MTDSILLDKREPRQSEFRFVILALIIGLVIGWGGMLMAAERMAKQSVKTILVPSNDYATPYEVCQKGFPFVLNQVIVQKVKGDENITWVAGHPLNQKQVIVCGKAGDYSDVWKRGMIIALYSADPT
jgi:hypothetical protein